MKEGAGGRILPVLAVFLSVVGAVLVLLFVLISPARDGEFADALASANLALEEEASFRYRQALTRGARSAVSVTQWRELLALAIQGIPSNPSPQDYRLFTTLASRAVAALPGNGDFLAYWTWGAQRSGQKKAEIRGLVQQIPSGKWDSLGLEIRIRDFLDQRHREENAPPLDSPDPEFLEQAGHITGDLVYFIDAALLYMEMGRSQKAFDVALRVVESPTISQSFHARSRANFLGAAASIAEDSGDFMQAYQWLNLRLDEASERRAESWVDWARLGDLRWRIFRQGRNPADALGALEAWEASAQLLEDGGGVWPESSWKLLINLATVYEYLGELRGAEEHLREALRRFPRQSEVKAAWAIKNAESQPGTARRLLTSQSSPDPVLETAMLRIGEVSISPSLYEARLWRLFEEATASNNSQLRQIDRREAATFVLEYLATRRDFASLDVAVDRYQSAHPEEHWILIWRMAADASRGVALLNLIPDHPEQTSPYSRYREQVRKEGNWRGFSDAALFALMAYDEAQNRGASPSSLDQGGIGRIEEHQALYAALSTDPFAMPESSSPLRDRMDSLAQMRPELEDAVKRFQSSSRKGQRAVETSGRIHHDVGIRLLANGRNDIAWALETQRPNSRQRAQLLYLDALILQRMGEEQEAQRQAQEALKWDEGHDGALSIVKQR
ncbi:MAG: tetratricopeptide repeat protein [Spirochaetales bacterium]|nr:tetratricopeptide repeat protein [Spirochaetales bacterium]